MKWLAHVSESQWLLFFFEKKNFYGHLTTVSSCKSHQAQLITVEDISYMMPVTVENNHHHLVLHFLGIKQT